MNTEYFYEKLHTFYYHVEEQLKFMSRMVSPRSFQSINNRAQQEFACEPAPFQNNNRKLKKQAWKQEIKKLNNFSVPQIIIDKHYTPTRTLITSNSVQAMATKKDNTPSVRKPEQGGPKAADLNARKKQRQKYNTLAYKTLPLREGHSETSNSFKDSAEPGEAEQPRINRKNQAHQRLSSLLNQVAGEPQ